MLKLAQFWGGGEIASADGLRFLVPVRTILAGPLQNISVLDEASLTITLLYLLEGLLEQETSLRLTEIMTDTHGYSEVRFWTILAIMVISLALG